MNTRNVQQLQAEIAATGLLPDDPPRILALAMALAGRGALLPSALTDQDCEHVAAVGQAFILSEKKLHGPDGTPTNFDRAIAAKLERIAKGEV